MTKKHFDLIAALLRRIRPLVPGEAFGIVAAALAAELAKTNPRFDAGRFLAAVGKPDA